MLQPNTTLRLYRNRQLERIAATWRAGWRITKLFAGLVAAWLLIGGMAIAAEQADTLRAGVAKRDITPTTPVAMAGYAARKDLSQGVHDPLSARVIAFEQEGKRLVLVSTDLIGFRGDVAESIRKAIITACQLQPSDLFLTAIHTHGGPNVTLDSQRGHANNVEYTKKLETQLVELTQEALAKMVPVQIGAGSGSCPVGVNRREVVPDKTGKAKIQLGRNPAGPTDPEVQVLKVTTPGTGELVAVVFGYASHSTSMGQGNYQITSDIHGLAEQFVEKYLDHGVVAPAFAGASGNIDPWVRVLPKFETANGWIPEPVLMGTMLGEEVVHTSNRIRNSSTAGPIKTAMKTLSLPGKPREGSGAAEATPVQLTITVARVGDVGLIGLGAEVFNEIGRAIKAASPFPHTLVITHCNGSAGYMPTRPAYDEGGYEVQSSRLAPGAAEQVIGESVRMLREL